MLPAHYIFTVFLFLELILSKITPFGYVSEFFYFNCHTSLKFMVCQFHIANN